MAGQHVKENDAEGIDIGTLIQGLSCRLFWRKVLRRTDDSASVRQGGSPILVAFLPEHFGETKVGKQYPAVGMKKDISGLQVAVDDPFGMGVIKGSSGLFKNGKGFAKGQRAPFLQELVQRTACDIGHHKIGDLLLLAIFINRYDVYMIERGNGISFTPETCQKVNTPRLISE